ncbi:hypothetical protein A3860_14870 [Niastella vici]|uniref:PsbP C-terminal domain-containing protein n=1 Tax=Niastella vici TaxID=1703345 RepID=A0A1V9G5P6_9BACT|nr:hypothetical protein [Niastella vici]OQP65874.1 hypothetical protein A3860_14870 [Niastella vici]
MKHLKYILTIFAFGILSFSTIDPNDFEFSYPKRNKTTITSKLDNFKNFDKEWRGTDYYYYGISTDSIICSVLYYKLNKDEQKQYVDIFGGMTNAGIPFAYFSENSNLKKYETNVENWGKMTDDFMFRQNDITEYEGIKIRQKHMYAYTMFDKDLFVIVHLSKTNYSSFDSTTMRTILDNFKKKN